MDSPEKMFQLFEDYRAGVKNNPRFKYVLSQKLGEMIPEPLEVPLTMVGFEGYVFSKGLNADLAQYFSNRDNKYIEYVAICSRIKKIINQDQIEGGMVGQYNASITQRLNGLAENVNQNHNVEQPLFPDVPKDDSNR